jgi:4,5-DOPA dioxygenase extradiol
LNLFFLNIIVRFYCPLLAVPTPEHCLPLLYALALKEENETITYFNDKPSACSLAMTSLIIDQRN